MINNRFDIEKLSQEERDKLALYILCSQNGEKKGKEIFEAIKSKKFNKKENNNE